MAIIDNILDDVFRYTLENDEDIAEKIMTCVAGA